MILFSEEEIRRLRDKLKTLPDALSQLRGGCESVMRYGIKIPKAGIATWGHYFACPEDAAGLEYDYAKDRDFRCPRCGKVYNGEPYLGAWWRNTNSVTTGSALNAALVWMLCGDEAYRELSARILTGFADNYPNYEEHGDIPYNRPGRMNSQIICEAACLEALAKAYDVIKTTLNQTERSHIEQDLLIPGAELLKKNRGEQLHNHEVIVNAALGVIGLAVERTDYTEYAVNSKYGLIYQLEHGVLDDGMWFENTFNYHYFALNAFMNYEKMARNTHYSLLNRAEYRRMYLMPLKLLQPDYSLPRIGDNGSVCIFRMLAGHYEFLYGIYGDRAFAGILNKIYERYPRQGLDVFFYGRDTIEKGCPELHDYHDGEASGLTAMRGSDRKQYLLFRHGRYGGEHDHYDKLSLHYAFGAHAVMPDLGTVSYGAPPHYGYFKNTFTHNTVCIDTQNQPPCNAHTTRYVKTEGETLVECRADWSEEQRLPDSFIIRQWDEEAYRGVRMDRTVVFADDYFLEAFRVRGAEGRQVDWIIHPKGECAQAPNDKQPLQLEGSKPLSYMKNARTFETREPVLSAWLSDAGRFSVCSACSHPASVIYAEGPDNPMSGTLTYLIRRVRPATDDVAFATIFRLDTGGKSLDQAKIEINGGTVSACFSINGKRRERVFTVGEE